MIDSEMTINEVAGNVVAVAVAAAPLGMDVRTVGADDLVAPVAEIQRAAAAVAAAAVE